MLAVAPLHEYTWAALFQQPSLRCYILTQLLLCSAELQLLLLYQGLQLHMLQLSQTVS